MGAWVEQSLRRARERLDNAEATALGQEVILIRGRIGVLRI